MLKLKNESMIKIKYNKSHPTKPNQIEQFEFATYQNSGNFFIMTTVANDIETITPIFFGYINEIKTLKNDE